MDTAVTDGLTPEDVLATEVMLARPRKAPDLTAEVAAFHELSVLMVANPARAIQRFLELAMTLCRAGSSGLSLLAEDDKGEPVFRWDALAGAFAPYVGGTTPRHFSPCGLCLDRNTAILVARPARAFHYFEAAEPGIAEGLIVPVRGIDAAAVGTLWVVHHDEQSQFDGEDARVMEELVVQLALALELLREVAARNMALQEAHHRVKNTLTATAGVLRLQARAVPSEEARAALDEALGRLGVFASVHDLLYRASATHAGSVEVTALLERLVDALRWSAFCADGRIRLRFSTEKTVFLSADAAIPLALIANEAVTNACKHAFPDGRAGEVEVRLGRDPDGTLLLTVRDDGAGLPTRTHEGSLGLKLIRAFALKLGAKLAVSGEDGTTITLKLPATAAEQSVQGGMDRHPGIRTDRWPQTQDSERALG